MLRKIKSLIVIVILVMTLGFFTGAPIVDREGNINQDNIKKVGVLITDSISSFMKTTTEFLDQVVIVLKNN